MAHLNQFNCLIQALRMIVGVVVQIRRREYYVTTVMMLTMQQFEPRLTKNYFCRKNSVILWITDGLRCELARRRRHCNRSCSAGKPAIALVRVGGLSIPYIGSIPYLHWIVVTGADPKSQQITYTDTNSQTYVLSYQDFQTMWNLGLDRDVSGAIASVLKSNGVESRTIVWVDK
jgi:hypothetical protein